jgi:predicted PurR-regulated permease PerM
MKAPMKQETTQWRTTTKYIVGVGIAFFGLVILYLSRPILPSLIIAGLIAFLARPLIRFFQARLRFPRGLAVFLTYLIAVLLILLLPLILIPSILSVVEFFIDLDYQLVISNALDSVRASLEYLQENGVQFLGIVIDLDAFIAPLIRSLEGISPIVTPSLPSISTILDSFLSAISLTFGVASGIISGFISFFFLIIASVYLSLDGQKFYRSFLDTLPSQVRGETDELVGRFKRIWDSFFRGQITLMVLIGTVVWLGGTLIGLPGAFALGVIAGILEILPNLGPVLATIPAVIVALIQGSSVLGVSNLVFALIVIGFYIVVQLMENYLVVPRVLGDAVKLHPLVVISGVIIGAATWGILGALIAAPVIATTREILLFLYGKIIDEPRTSLPPLEDRAETTVESADDDLKGRIAGTLHRLGGRPKTLPEVGDSSEGPIEVDPDSSLES